MKNFNNLYEIINPYLIEYNKKSQFKLIKLKLNKLHIEVIMTNREK